MMENDLLNENSSDIVFENEELNTEDLITGKSTDFDFNLRETIGFEKTINRATKPKNLTKKQKKTRNKIAKQSRRINRH